MHWLPIVLSRKEVKKLLAAPDCTDLERLVLRTLYASGMRVEELVALKHQALDGKTSTIRLADRQVVVDRKTMRQLLALDWKAWRWTVDSVERWCSETSENMFRTPSPAAHEPSPVSPL